MSTKGERKIAYWMIAPALLLLVVFRLLPIILGLRESFFAVSFLQGGAKIFVGFENFAALLNDSVFLKSVEVTLLFNLIINPLQTVLALGLAFLVNRKVRAIAFFRSVYLIPVAMSINVSSLIWRLALDPNGMVNGILTAIGLPAQPFLVSSGQALLTIIGIASWIGVPFWSLFLLAGLQGIPEEIYEAAQIDGANKRNRFRYVTLPMMRRPLTFVLIANTIANFLLFIPVFLLTRGGPELSTNLLMYETYRRGIIYGDLGTSAAMVIMQLLIVIVIIIGQYALLRDPS